jgi:hypothetical protein
MRSILVAALAAAAVFACSPQASAQGRWVHCASEGEFCRAPFGAIVHFGADGSFAHRRNERGGMPCSNRVFGDPAVGVHKECFFSYPHRDYDEGDDGDRPPLRRDWRY